MALWMKGANDGHRISSFARNASTTILQGTHVRMQKCIYASPSSAAIPIDINANKRHTQGTEAGNAAGTPPALPPPNTAPCPL